MEIDKNNLHHAYLLLGKKTAAEDYFGSFFEILNIDNKNNPDLHYFTENPFGIDNARRLKSLAESKSFGTKKIFIIYSSEITLEAQNALLKVFEEPTPNTHFFIVNQKNILIPTLLSRIQVLRLTKENSLAPEATSFLKSTLPERLVYIKNLNKDENFSLSDFLEDLLQTLNKKTNLTKHLKSVFKFSKYSSDPAANTRLILEHLALTIPERLE